MNPVHVNIVSFDYFMQDVSEYNQYTIRKLKFPVIRVFGSTLSGQQSCIFIHGFFPYFYFRPEQLDEPLFQNKDEIEK